MFREFCYFYHWNIANKSKNSSKGKVSIASRNKKIPKQLQLFMFEPFDFCACITIEFL